METRAEQKLPVTELKHSLKVMMRQLGHQLKADDLKLLNQFYKNAYHLLGQEEKKIKALPKTSRVLRRTALEKRIAERNQQEAHDQEVRENRDDLLDDQLDVHHDKIVELQQDENNALVESQVSNTDIQLQIRAKQAQIEVEIDNNQPSCWASLFCCHSASPKLKQLYKDLENLERQLKANRERAQAVDNDDQIDQINAERDQALQEKQKLIDEQAVSLDGESDKEEEELADVTFLIKQSLTNQQHVISLETMEACFKLYEFLLILRQKSENINNIVDMNGKSKQTNEQSFIKVVLTTINSFIDKLAKKLKAFFYKDEDEMTTTFMEFHDKFQEASLPMNNDQTTKLLKANGLLTHLLEDNVQDLILLTQESKDKGDKLKASLGI